MPESLALERAIKAQNGECLTALAAAASKFTYVAMREIHSKCVCARIARVRAAITLAAHERRISFPVIGAFFDHKDHTSAWNARNRAVELEKTQPDFAKLMCVLRAVE